MSVSNVTNVFTLINAYTPQGGVTLATVQFLGTGGASETFDLVGGTNIRDFYQDGYTNTINGTTTQNAFSCTAPTNCLGGGGTGNVNTGLSGTYVIDEQDFTLNSSFVGQTLTEIIITNTDSNSTPIVLGITAADITSTPLPAALPLFATGLGALALLGWRRKRTARSVAA